MSDNIQQLLRKHEKEEFMATTIERVRVICTAPEGINLVVVKVDTNQDGLYGLGCATFAYRHLAVKTSQCGKH